MESDVSELEHDGGTKHASLSELAVSCDHQLKDLCVGLDESMPLDAVATVDDVLGRFRVWGRNIGAFQASDSPSSLDLRLTSSYRMREAVQTNLEYILQSARQAASIVSEERPNRTAPGLNMEEASAPEQPATTELEELLLGIQSSVDRLFRLSMLMRRVRPRGRNPTRKVSAGDDDTSIDIRHVRDKFSKIRDVGWLSERLGRAITQRRNFIVYRQSHQQRLANTVDDSGDYYESQHPPSTIATTYNSVLSGTDINAGIMNSAQSRRTGVTSFLTITREDGIDELLVPTLNSLVFNGIKLEFDEPFECPFCRTIQICSDEPEWRRHVFRDLQPYVCTFEDCSVDLFSTRREWFRHEMDVHRREWYCNQCHTKFTSHNQLYQHLTTTHKSISGNQLPVIVEASQRPIQDFGAVQCPLCDAWPLNQPTPTKAEDFCRHLGQHLQQLALSALPQSIPGLEVLEEESPEGDPEPEEDPGPEGDPELEADSDLLAATNVTSNQEPAASAHDRPTQQPIVAGPYKFTHRQLENDRTISRTNVPENRKGNIYFNFFRRSEENFSIVLHYKGRNRGLLELDFSIGNLMEMLDNAEEDLDMEYVSLNVSRLLTVLDKIFKLKKGW